MLARTQYDYNPKHIEVLCFIHKYKGYVLTQRSDPHTIFSELPPSPPKQKAGMRFSGHQWPASLDIGHLLRPETPKDRDLTSIYSPCRSCKGFWTICSPTKKRNMFLVGGWTNPFEKYARQIGSFPNRDENKKYLKPPPRFLFWNGPKIPVILLMVQESGILTSWGW